MLVAKGFKIRTYSFNHGTLLGFCEGCSLGTQRKSNVSDYDTYNINAVLKQHETNRVKLMLYLKDNIPGQVT